MSSITGAELGALDDAKPCRAGDDIRRRAALNPSPGTGGGSTMRLPLANPKFGSGGRSGLRSPVGSGGAWISQSIVFPGSQGGIGTPGSGGGGGVSPARSSILRRLATRPRGGGSEAVLSGRRGRRGSRGGRGSPRGLGLPWPPASSTQEWQALPVASRQPRPEAHDPVEAACRRSRGLWTLRTPGTRCERIVAVRSAPSAIDESDADRVSKMSPSGPCPITAGSMMRGAGRDEVRFFGAQSRHSQPPSPQADVVAAGEMPRRRHSARLIVATRAPSASASRSRLATIQHPAELGIAPRRAAGLLQRA